MNFPLYIARHYLFSKKKQNAINIISVISALSLAAGTAALVCVMSVFNGFEAVVGTLFGNFDPQVKITAAEGKAFDPSALAEIENMAEVEHFDEVIEDNALLQFRSKQLPLRVKGVGENYGRINRIEDIMVEGEFLLHYGNYDMGVGGAALAREIGAGVRYADPMFLYAPRRGAKYNPVNPESSFNREALFYAGTFLVQQEQYDRGLLIAPIDLARRLFDYPSEVTAVEIKLREAADEKSCIEKMRELAGPGFVVADRYEQQRDVYKMMQIEKWITYLILSFILLVALFNLVGTMTMLILDKREDLATLRSLGMRRRDCFGLFMWQGALITLIGAAAGMLLGLALCLVQEHFGLIRLANDYIVSAYPVRVQAGDLAVIFLTVCLMGMGACAYPASRVLKN